jgi:hypothetical protein
MCEKLLAAKTNLHYLMCHRARPRQQLQQARLLLEAQRPQQLVLWMRAPWREQAGVMTWTWGWEQ